MNNCSVQIFVYSLLEVTTIAARWPLTVGRAVQGSPCKPAAIWASENVTGRRRDVDVRTYHCVLCKQKSLKLRVGMPVEKAVFGRVRLIGSGRVLATCSVILKFAYRYHHFSAVPSGRAVFSVGLRPFACRVCGFESRLRYGCLSVVIVLCCQIEVSSTGWPLVQRSHTDCGVSCVI